MKRAFKSFQVLVVVSPSMAIDGDRRDPANVMNALGKKRARGVFSKLYDGNSPAMSTGLDRNLWAFLSFQVCPSEFIIVNWYLIV